MSEFEIITLKTGVKSLRSVNRRETFHPVTGPWVEAKILHVNQQRLVERSKQVQKFVIWDVGLGAAANVLAAIDTLLGAYSDMGEVAQESAAEIEIHSFDQTTAPAEFALLHADELIYPLRYRDLLTEFLEKGKIRISPKMSWNLHLGDFREQIRKSLEGAPSATGPNSLKQASHAPALCIDLPAPHAILYDPYSPSSNPEMWSLDHFQNLKACLDPHTPRLLTSYSRSTAVRVTFLLAGFLVGSGCEIGEKAETTVASNQLKLLCSPLDATWLKRIERSTHSAPLRTQFDSQTDSQAHLKRRMTSEEYERLKALPQFA